MAISFYQDIYNMLSKKHPNKKIFVIGDQHFDHNNILHYTRKDFSTIDEMNSHIIEEHNKIVSSEDVVIFLGDLGFKKNTLNQHLSKMNGHKYLILGNHDKTQLLKDYQKIGLEGVFLNPIKIENDYLSHEPLNLEEQRNTHFKIAVNEFNKTNSGINYHGHIHTKENQNTRHKNATCEALDYKPLFIGTTENYSEKNKKELIINTKYFDILLEEIQKKHNLNPKLIIADYIYSIMLEANKQYMEFFFVNGSYALYKKYDFISNFSDLDIALIHNLEQTKKKSFSMLKNITYNAYEELKKIDGINLNLYKLYDTIRIFESFFTSRLGHHIECDFDGNIIPYNFYRESDFLVQEKKTTLEKYMKPSFSNLTSEYHFPTHQTQFLTANGDISNLLLQILFQEGFEQKKALAIKKINYIYKKIKSQNSLENLDDIFTRYFLRNIAFFHTLNRYSEIEYIQTTNINIEKLLTSLPNELATQVFELFKNPNSLFYETYQEICNTQTEETFKKGTEIIDKIKVKK